MTKKLKVAQVIVVSSVLAATGAEIMARDPEEHPHTEAESQVPDQPIGRAAALYAVTSTASADSLEVLGRPKWIKSM